MRFFKYLSLMTLFVIQASCIDFNDIVMVNSDGSSQLTFQVSLPDLESDKKLKDPDKSKKEIISLFQSLSKSSLQVLENTDKKEAGLEKLTMKVALSSLEQLKIFYRVLGEESGKKPEGSSEKEDYIDKIFTSHQIEIKPLSDRRVRITRTFTPPKIKEEKKKKDSGPEFKELEQGILGSIRFRFEWNTPLKIVSSNAHSMVGNSARWEVSIGSLMKQPFSMQIELEGEPDAIKQLIKK
ncbi:MAG: hypothetical protein JNK65_01220 [Deltaproteobacteria bacterium]|nr:hypothetical protein [Deltaproteobacteria bacterium]